MSERVLIDIKLKAPAHFSAREIDRYCAAIPFLEDEPPPSFRPSAEWLRIHAARQEFATAAKAVVAEVLDRYATLDVDRDIPWCRFRPSNGNEKSIDRGSSARTERSTLLTRAIMALAPEPKAPTFRGTILLSVSGEEREIVACYGDLVRSLKEIVPNVEWLVRETTPDRPLDADDQVLSERYAALIQTEVDDPAQGPSP